MWLIKYYLVLLKYCLTVKLKIVAKCDWCGLETESRDDIKHGNSVFCYRKCMNEFYAHFTETKEKDDKIQKQTNE